MSGYLLKLSGGVLIVADIISYCLLCQAIFLNSEEVYSRQNRIRLLPAVSGYLLKHISIFVPKEDFKLLPAMSGYLLKHIIPMLKKAFMDSYCLLCQAIFLNEKATRRYEIGIKLLPAMSGYLLKLKEAEPVKLDDLELLPAMSGYLLKLSTDTFDIVYKVLLPAMSGYLLKPYPSCGRYYAGSLAHLRLKTKMSMKFIKIILFSLITLHFISIGGKCLFLYIFIFR